MLTWWQGDMDAGVGFGEDVIYNSSYQQIAVVQAANGLTPTCTSSRSRPRGRP